MDGCVDFGKRAGAAIGRAARAGAGLYDREARLPMLIALDPALVADASPATTRLILSRLRRALRAERNRARSGHWSYDLNRHIALAQAYRAERERAEGGAGIEPGERPAARRRRGKG